MTFEILFPFAALALAGVGVFWIRHEARKLDRDLAAKDHPAE